MDKDKLKAFTMPIAIVLLTFVVIVLGFQKITEIYGSYSPLKSEVEQKTTQLEELKTKIENLKQEAEKEQNIEKNTVDEKPFYKPIMEGLDSEAIIAGEFTEILQLIRDSKIKVRSIKYDYKPDDAFLTNAPDKYNVARLSMEMVSNYTSYNNFLKSLYKHDHFLDIESVEIVPYKKNKTYLLINFKLKLYAKK